MLGRGLGGKNIRGVKVYAQFVDVGRDVAASGGGGEGGLLEAEDDGGEGAYAFLFELAAGLEAFPGSWDLDADAARLDAEELLDVGDEPWRCEQVSEGVWVMSQLTLCILDGLLSIIG